MQRAVGVLTIDQRLLRLLQVELPGGTGVITGLHHRQRLLADFQPRLLLLDLLIKVGDLPIILRRVADQRQRGILPILFLGLSLPLRLLSGSCQLAPQIHFIA
ncbi:hypothetical protein D3C76_1677270 [compost metagenome]